MSVDFLDTLAELALGSRLKRLSERMLANAAIIYEEFGMQINPKWFTLLALLDDRLTNGANESKHATAPKSDLTIVEASELLGLSQPALSQFCKQLEQEGLITVTKGSTDGRQRVLKLSTKGQSKIAQMKPIWALVNEAAIDLCTEENNDFYASLLEFERAFSRKSLLQRTREQQLNVQSPTTQKRDLNQRLRLHKDAIEVIPFTPDNAHYFETINKQWINDMFVLEDIDKKVLEQPQINIIDQGGKIWFARHPNLGIVGTCALLKKSDGKSELTKMGVLSSARGLKVGEILLQYVINHVKSMHIQQLFLLTNKKCEAAIHLYEKNGFVHDSKIMDTYGKLYERCNVAMNYPLD